MQVLIGQPLDTVKVRCQALPGETPMSILMPLIRNEGFLGFYKGMLSPLVGTPAFIALQFVSNQRMTRYFTEVNRRNG